MNKEKLHIKHLHVKYILNREANKKMLEKMYYLNINIFKVFTNLHY